MGAFPSKLTAFGDLVMGPIDRMASGLAAFAPHALSALIIVVAGLVLARGLRTAWEVLAARIKLDERTSLVGLNEVVQRLGLGRSPSSVLGGAVYWLLLVSFLIAALNALQLGAANELVDKFLRFLPSLAAALVTAFAGLAFAQFLSGLVAESARANGLRGGEGLSRAVLVGLWIATGLVSLEQLGLANSVLMTALQIVFASAGLALALAFGLGGRDLAADVLRRFLEKDKS